MNNRVSMKETIEFLQKCDNVNIITHKAPDGDTLGCGFALVNALRSMGKKANVINSEPFPARYSFLYEGYEPMEFDVECVISVDVADTQLIGSNLPEYKEENAIDFAIDHHISNTFFAKQTYLDETAAAACEAIYLILREMGVEITNQIAKCLYTGIATDTGCFKYQNTTPRTHIIASELIVYDINFARINRQMFDLKSKGRQMVEQVATNNMEFFFNDRCAMITISTELVEKSGAEPAEFEGLSSKTLQVEGVMIGILIKQRDTDRFKISVRTAEEIDACAFCNQFGGGGHIRAAGCEICGSLSQVKTMLIDAVKEVLGD